MPTLRRISIVFACASAALVPAVASASHPAGVWALVEKVTLEPDVNKPTMIRIDGVFMVANTPPDFPQYPGYSVPAHGYMYYQCGDADLATCQLEWAELAAVPMSPDICRGWGDNSLPDNGTVRAAEPQDKPDVWPISMGILTGFTPCDALKAWKAENPPPAEGTDSDSDSDGSSSGDGSSGGASESDGSSGGDSSGNFDSSSSGGGSTGAPGSTGGSSGGEPDPSTGGGSSPTSDGPGGTSDGGASSGSSGGSSDGGLAPTGDKGCACRTDDDHAPLGALASLLGLLALVRRRRA